MKKRATKSEKRRDPLPTLGNAPGDVDVTREFLARLFCVDVRSVGNFTDGGMPKTARGRFPLVACTQWYLRRERDTARAGKGLNDLDRARERKTLAEAEEAELRVQQILGNVVPLAVVDDVAGRLADRLLPVLQNIPSNFTLRLEECGMSAAKAEAVLEAIAVELTTTLRDSLEDEGTDDSDVEEPS